MFGNDKPHYLHDGFWYGQNVIQSGGYVKLITIIS